MGRRANLESWKRNPIQTGTAPTAELRGLIARLEGMSNPPVSNVPDAWIPHNREDGEHVGWIVPDGEGFVTVDLLGRQRIAEPVDWMAAEEAMDGLGIGYLADIHAFRAAPDDWVRVRIVEVSTDGITVKEDDFGDVAADLPRYRLPFPASDDLRLIQDAPGQVRNQFG